MAPPDGTPATETPPGVPLHRRLTFAGFAGLVILAAVFYFWWGFAYGRWLDNGVYAVTIVLLLFGLSGMWLVTPNPPVPAAAPGGP